MKTLPRLLAASALLLAVSACGSVDEANSPATPPDQSSTTPPSSSSAAPDNTDIVSVSLRQTGGLKATTVNRVFSAGEQPPRGFTAAEVAAALDAASAFVSSDVPLVPVPRLTCCDRTISTVTITLAGGKSTSYPTIDGLNQPASFEKLMSLLA